MVHFSEIPNAVLLFDIKKHIFQILQSNLVWTHNWPFDGRSDLHFGNQKVTLKKLVVTRKVLFEPTQYPRRSIWVIIEPPWQPCIDNVSWSTSKSKSPSSITVFERISKRQAMIFQSPGVKGVLIFCDGLLNKDESPLIGNQIKIT